MRSGESTCLPPMWPVFDSRTLRAAYLVEFVVGSRHCSDGFFSPGTPIFPSPQKPTILNSNSIWKVSPISALR